MHGHGAVIAAPDWLGAVADWLGLLYLGLLLYMSVAFVTGCPYCLYPNLGWPKDLTVATGRAIGRRVP